MNTTESGSSSCVLLPVCILMPGETACAALQCDSRLLMFVIRRRPCRWSASGWCLATCDRSRVSTRTAPCSSARARCTLRLTRTATTTGASGSPAERCCYNGTSPAHNPAHPLHIACNGRAEERPGVLLCAECRLHCSFVDCAKPLDITLMLCLFFCTAQPSREQHVSGSGVYDGSYTALPDRCNVMAGYSVVQAALARASARGWRRGWRGARLRA